MSVSIFSWLLKMFSVLRLPSLFPQNVSADGFCLSVLWKRAMMLLPISVQTFEILSYFNSKLPFNYPYFPLNIFKQSNTTYLRGCQQYELSIPKGARNLLSSLSSTGEKIMSPTLRIKETVGFLFLNNQHLRKLLLLVSFLFNLKQRVN